MRIQQGFSERAKNYRLHVYLNSVEQTEESEKERTLLSSRESVQLSDSLNETFDPSKTRFYNDYKNIEKA